MKYGGEERWPCCVFKMRPLVEAAIRLPCLGYVARGELLVVLVAEVIFFFCRCRWLSVKVMKREPWRCFCGYSRILRTQGSALCTSLLYSPLAERLTVSLAQDFAIQERSVPQGLQPSTRLLFVSGAVLNLPGNLVLSLSCACVRSWYLLV